MFFYPYTPYRINPIPNGGAKMPPLSAKYKNAYNFPKNTRFMTSYLHHNTISRRETFPDKLVKIRLDDVVLCHVT